MGLYVNTVRRWPSVSEIIIAERLQAVELVFLGLDGFYPTPRSTNSMEDNFCKRPRMVGGKWRKGYWDYRQATVSGARMVYPDEREVLFPGWSKDGGLLVLRYDSWKQVVGDIGTIYNTLTMEERCEAIEISGGIFFEDPEDCEFTGPLLKSFGEHNRRTPRRRMRVGGTTGLCS
jgi:hypothetical protein